MEAEREATAGMDRVRRRFSEGDLARLARSMEMRFEEGSDLFCEGSVE
jgi:hypothetical protein